MKMFQRLPDSLRNPRFWVSLSVKLFTLTKTVVRLQKNPEWATEEGDDDYSYDFRTEL